MLNILTIIKPSYISGKGVFTQQPIARGQIVWRVDQNSYINDHDFAILRDAGVTQWIEKYGTVDEDGWWYVDKDNTRFMNHSPNPNILFAGSVGVALEEIAAGTELTCDYRDITQHWHVEKLLGESVPRRMESTPKMPLEGLRSMDDKSMVYFDFVSGSYRWTIPVDKRPSTTESSLNRRD